MSRIYEALQKAESERKSGRNGGQETFVAEQVPVKKGYSPAAVAEYEIPVDRNIYASEVEITPEPALPAAASGLLELENVPRHTWTPTYSQLPALLERGPAVEQFRTLRSRIFELRDIKPLKSILIS